MTQPEKHGREQRGPEPVGKELVRRASAMPARPANAGMAPAAGRRRIVVDAAGVVGRAATHERTRDSVRWVARNTIVYPLTGMFVLFRRCWEACTNARYERLLRAAEAAGDYDRLSDWEQRAEQARERRHRRRMDWITAPLDIARGVAVGMATGIGLLLALGAVLAIAHRDPGWLLTPVQKVVDGIAWVVWLLGVLWAPVLLVVPGWWWPGCGRPAAGTAVSRGGPPPVDASTRR
jgi:S-DNA-T family DNA segregation ATPase FtsK/SpoIIIE